MSKREQTLKLASELYQEIFPGKNFYILNSSDYFYNKFINLAEKLL